MPEDLPLEKLISEDSLAGDMPFGYGAPDEKNCGI
jgi:hypothetical protein